MSTSRPRITIGLPVYNGANYVACAIESVLAQTHGDFELIISDNASTDATEEICRDFAARDRRVRYDRLDRNIGASANFNRVFALARGEFFRWQAHDDALAPTCLERCLGQLDLDRSAVLCHSLVQRIGPDGEALELYDSGLALRSRRPSRRFAAALLTWHDCTEMFALIRTSALAGTPLIAPYAGSDRALIAELALRGRFLKVPEPLFLNRDHPRRYIRSVWRSHAEAMAWYNPNNQGKRVLHTVELFRNYLRAVRDNVHDPVERMRCRALVIRAATAMRDNRNSLVKDALWAVSPRMVEMLTATRRRVAGASG